MTAYLYAIISPSFGFVISYTTILRVCA